jgi:hypothetical protein
MRKYIIQSFFQDLFEYSEDMRINCNMSWSKVTVKGIKSNTK